MRLPVERDWRVSSHASVSAHYQRVAVLSSPPRRPAPITPGNPMPTLAHWLIISAIIIGTGVILAFALHVSLLR
jgi:hypothetical protein